MSLVDFTTMTSAQLYDTGLVLSDGSLGTYDGSEEVLLSNGLKALWAGNSRNTDNKVKYAGTNSDPSTILGQVLAHPGNVTAQQFGYDLATPVYLTGDINLDGKVKYSGTNNDSSFILYNVVSKYPNNLTNKQYPFDLMTEQIPVP